VGLMSRSQSKAEQSLVAGRGGGKAKFMEQVRTFMRARRYSLRTGLRSRQALAATVLCG